MSCVIYKGSEKLLVDPVALSGMLAQGWSLHPQKVKRPSAEEFEEFMNLHEELKRISDEALTIRDNKITDLIQQNEQLTEDIEGLEGENIDLRQHLVTVLEELKAFKEQAPKISAEPDKTAETSSKVVELDYRKQTIRQLKAHAKRANIPNYKLMRKAQLIEALKNGSQSKD